MAYRNIAPTQAPFELFLCPTDTRFGEIVEEALDLIARYPKLEESIEKDLDEAAGAYKNIDEVMENQKDLVKIILKLQPLAVIKG